MSKRTLLLTAAVLLVAAGCTPQTPSGDGTSSSSAMMDSSSSESLPETSNVTYTGVVSALLGSTATDATHTLLLDSGRSLLLVSTDLNLQLGSYMGKRVDVRGSTKVSGTESVLRVTEVVVLQQASSASAAKMCGGIAGIACEAGMTCVDDPSDSCDPMNGGADCSGICVAGSSSSSASVASSSSSSSSVAPASSAPAAVSSSSSSKPAVSSSSSSAASVSASESEIATMAKQNYATPGLWSQKYCTSHIGFCVPVHKNWYYKSFGATTSTLWHVEFGMSDIQALGQGAISLNLISGTSAEAGGTDGQAIAKGGLIIAYKDWEGGRHLEIAADGRLTEAVTYMLSKLEQFAPAE